MHIVMAESQKCWLGRQNARNLFKYIFFNLFLIFSFILNAYSNGRELEMLDREAKHKKFV